MLYASLRSSLLIVRILRTGGIHLATCIFGLLLSAIAVQLVADGVRGFIRAG